MQKQASDIYYFTQLKSKVTVRAEPIKILTVSIYLPFDLSGNQLDRESVCAIEQKGKHIRCGPGEKGLVSHHGFKIKTHVHRDFLQSKGKL